MCQRPAIIGSFSETLISPTIQFPESNTTKKSKKWRTHEQYSSIRIFSSNFLSFFSYQIRTTNSLFFISDSNNNTQTVPNPNHTHTLFHSDSHLNSTITTATVCLIPQVSFSNQNKEEEEAVWSFPDHFFSPFSRPKQEGSFFSFSFIFFVQKFRVLKPRSRLYVCVFAKTKYGSVKRGTRGRDWCKNFKKKS